MIDLELYMFRTEFFFFFQDWILTASFWSPANLPLLIRLNNLTLFLTSHFLLHSAKSWWIYFQNIYPEFDLVSELPLLAAWTPCFILKLLQLCTSVQSLTHVQLFVTPWAAAYLASLSITNSQSLLKLMSIESVMPPNHLILCRPLLLLPSIIPRIRVFWNESVLHFRWPQYWSFSFSISPSNEYSGLISFRMNWLGLLVVQGTFKSLLQHLSSKASILWHSVFFIVQLSHPYMTTGKTIALNRQTLLAK